MNKEIIAAGDSEIEKCKFHYFKISLFHYKFCDVDIEKILITPNKVSFGKKKVLNVLLVTKKMKNLSHY